MKTAMILFMSLTLATCAFADTGTTSPIDLNLAAQYFHELKTISDNDAGHLWGVTLYGPTIFVDPNTRTVVANQMNNGHSLTPDHGAFVGTLDKNINISNTAAEWSGTTWTMINWYALSPTDQYDRDRLLVHESWHRIQNEIGIPGVTTANAYLDHGDGRIYLILEFRAIRHALLAAEPAARSEAIDDALTFRLYRQSLHTGNNENAFERHEGMAEYTGLKLCGLPDSLLIRIAAKKLELGENNDGLANSFAYLTGSALGLLLDDYKFDWRTQLRDGKDLPALLSQATGWHAPEGDNQLKHAADSLGRKYGEAEVVADVTARDKEQQQTVDSFRDRLTTHGRLFIPNVNVRFSFNPMEKLVPFDTIGVIYNTMRLSGDFGVLEASDGILRSNNWKYFIAVAPDSTAVDSVARSVETAGSHPIEWPGYRLDLNPGWHLTPDSSGTYVIERE